MNFKTNPIYNQPVYPEDVDEWTMVEVKYPDGRTVKAYANQLDWDEFKEYRILSLDEIEDFVNNGF